MGNFLRVRIEFILASGSDAVQDYGFDITSSCHPLISSFLELSKNIWQQISSATIYYIVLFS